ncbi:hypothetical protein Sjap_021766 [Stephania japonica]|uniref:Prolyl endopeptidase n=1 Tax=Stephania japonica TaxID=461633 RepID=A0AAP0HS13_9MAGN
MPLAVAALIRARLSPLNLRLFISSPFSSLCKGNLFSSSPHTPPSPKKTPFNASAHGKTWQDHYRWMSNTDDPDLLEYLNKENSYADAFMSDTANFQRKLFSEMKSRLPTSISTPPERWGPWLYYQYIPEGKEYPVLCRARETQENGWVDRLVNYVKGVGRTEVLLDWNELAERYGYVHVGTCRISPNHNFLAYTLDGSGDEHFMLQIKDLQTRRIFPKSRVDGVVSLAWANDGKTLFYTVSDEKQRPSIGKFYIAFQCLDSDFEHVTTVFTESDSKFCVDITSTKDGKFITVNSNSRTSSEEVHLFIVQWFLLHPYECPLSETEHLVGGSYYLVRHEAKDFQSSKFQNVIVPSLHVSFQDMDIFDKHLVLFVEKNGCSMICSVDMPIDINCKQLVTLDDLNPWFFPLPSNLCQIVPGSNHDFLTSNYRVVSSSPVLPDVVIDYDMSKKKFYILQQEEVVGVDSDLKYMELLNAKTIFGQHFDDAKVQKLKDLSNILTCERKEVISHDGVLIPLTILFSTKDHKKGHSPGILLGYGCYGEVLDKSWCAERLSLLDRGWIIAFADVRGGGGVSPSWHKDGTGLLKLNSVYDFVACAKFLIDEGYVHKNYLCSVGHSAGGLLLGVAINKYPDLFRAAILKVPFLDVCNTLLDPSLPLTTLDYEEFGDPTIPAQFEYINSYSPYDNIPSGFCCPSMLVTASFLDSRQVHTRNSFFSLSSSAYFHYMGWSMGSCQMGGESARKNVSFLFSCSDIKNKFEWWHFGQGGHFGQCEEAALDLRLQSEEKGPVALYLFILLPFSLGLGPLYYSYCVFEQ